ncbi:hypothetical protein FQA39_LY00785 [Lamprigera yunnana]|nr:hypothetical protein FQA39_LY00785 [Lamprigera yunnana]
MASDIKCILSEKINKLKGFGLTLQPTPIIVGHYLTHITALYVVLDQHLFQVPTILEAIDVCFKIIHTLHACYPVEAEPVWLLIPVSADIIVSVEAKMYKIRDAKDLNEADMLWLLEHDDSDVDNVETNLADSDDNEDYLSEQDINIAASIIYDILKLQNLKLKLNVIVGLDIVHNITFSRVTTLILSFLLISRCPFKIKPTFMTNIVKGLVYDNLIAP